MANLKHYNSATSTWEEIKVSTRFKDLLNTVKLTQDQSNVNIGITGFNTNDDVIFVYLNSTWLQKDEDYILNDGLLRIESKDGSNWKNGDTFNFVILKNVDKDAIPTADGSLIQDGSITISKLATSIQNYITKVGTATLSTTATDLSGAVNEVNADLANRSNKNYIINGNFDIWQRGTSFTNPTPSTFLSDRFRTGGTLTTPPTTIIHSKQTVVNGELNDSFHYHRVATSDPGILNSDDNYGIIQSIENGVRYLCGANKKITISFYARSSIVGKKLGVFFAQNYGTGGTPSNEDIVNGSYVVLNSNWTKYVISISTSTLVNKTFGSNNDDRLKIIFRYAYGVNAALNINDTVAETFRGSGTIDIAQVKVEKGDKATPFVPRLYGEELLLCQRYFQCSNEKGNSFPHIGILTANGTAGILRVPVQCQMRVGPISTLKGSLAVVNTTITISAITPDQYSSDTIKVSVTLSSSIQNGLYAVEGNNSNTADIWLDAEIY